MDRRALASQRGFTLVETLVVVLIVAILAAVGLVLFVNQRTKAQDAEAKTAAATATRALVIHHQERDTFADADVARLARIEPTLAGTRGLEVRTTDDTYRVKVDSAAGASGGGPFVIEHAAGRTRRTCDAPGRGACPADGRW